MKLYIQPMTARDTDAMRETAKRVPCRQCGEPVEYERGEWATPVCYACLRPIARRTTAETVNVVDCSTLLTPRKP